MARKSDPDLAEWARATRGASGPLSIKGAPDLVRAMLVAIRDHTARVDVPWAAMAAKVEEDLGEACTADQMGRYVRKHERALYDEITSRARR